jgi:hypothetical protein
LLLLNGSLTGNEYTAAAAAAAAATNSCLLRSFKKKKGAYFIHFIFSAKDP